MTAVEGIGGGQISAIVQRHWQRVAVRVRLLYLREQMVVKGVVLLAAVGFDTYQKNSRAGQGRRVAAKGVPA